MRGCSPVPRLDTVLVTTGTCVAAEGRVLTVVDGAVAEGEPAAAAVVPAAAEAGAACVPAGGVTART